MIIYFRSKTEISLLHKEKNFFEYSSEPYETKEMGYKYFEFTVPDIFSDSEIDALCHKMINEHTDHNIPLSSTLDKEIERMEQLIGAIRDFKEYKSDHSNLATLNISVHLVARACFNDERLIDSMVIDLSELEGNELVWIDVYLNKLAGNKIRIAPVFSCGDEMYFLEDNNGKINVVKKMLFSKYYTDNYDSNYIISAEFYCSRKR